MNPRTFIAKISLLTAASNGLAAWFHNGNRDDTAREFNLRPEQRVLLAQSVSYPA